MIPFRKPLVSSRYVSLISNLARLLSARLTPPIEIAITKAAISSVRRLNLKSESELFNDATQDVQVVLHSREVVAAFWQLSIWRVNQIDQDFLFPTLRDQF